MRLVREERRYAVARVRAREPGNSSDARLAGACGASLHGKRGLLRRYVFDVAGVRAIGEFRLVCPVARARISC